MIDIVVQMQKAWLPDVYRWEHISSRSPVWFTGRIPLGVFYRNGQTLNMPWILRIPWNRVSRTTPPQVSWWS